MIKRNNSSNGSFSNNHTISKTLQPLHYLNFYSKDLPLKMSNEPINFNHTYYKINTVPNERVEGNEINVNLMLNNS